MNTIVDQMKKEAVLIATRINRVVARWNSEKIAVRYNQAIDFELESYNFENSIAKSLFKTIINSEFSRMSNYRLVFPEIMNS